MFRRACGFNFTEKWYENKTEAVINKRKYKTQESKTENKKINL